MSLEIPLGGGRSLVLSLQNSDSSRSPARFVQQDIWSLSTLRSLHIPIRANGNRAPAGPAT